MRMATRRMCMSMLALREAETPLVSTCHNWYDMDLLVSFYGRGGSLVLRKYARQSWRSPLR